MFIAASRSVQYAKARDFEGGERGLIRRITIDLARDVAQHLRQESLTEEVASRIQELEAYASCFLWEGEITVSSEDDRAAALLRQSPLRALGDVLDAYNLIAPEGGSSALDGYRLAVNSIDELDANLLIPSSVGPANLSNEEIRAAYWDCLEVAFFGGSWPDPNPGDATEPESLVEVRLHALPNHGADARPFCKISQSDGTWTFHGLVQGYAGPGRDDDYFEHKCSDLAQALRAVPWNRVSSIQTLGGRQEDVRALLLPFAVHGAGLTGRLDDVRLNDEPLVTGEAAQSAVADMPVITVTRDLSDAPREVWEIRGQEPLGEIMQRDLHVLRKGQAVEYYCRGPVDDLLAILTVDPSGGNEDPATWGDSRVVDSWAGEDNELLYQFGDLPLLTRWVRVEGQSEGGRLVALSAEGAENTLIFVDVSEGTINSGEDLLHFSWFAEGAGAPVSWDGGCRVVDLGRGWLLRHRWGDLGTEYDTIWTTDLLQQAEFLRDAITYEEAEVPAALMLETLDPGKSLSPEALDHWQDLLHELTLSLDLSCGDELAHRVRDLLMERPLYVACRNALAEPMSPLGQRFLSALEDSVASGVPGAVQSGSWVSAD